MQERQRQHSLMVTLTSRFVECCWQALQSPINALQSAPYTLVPVLGSVLSMQALAGRHYNEQLHGLLTAAGSTVYMVEGAHRTLVLHEVSACAGPVVLATVLLVKSTNPCCQQAAQGALEDQGQCPVSASCDDVCLW